MTNSFTSSFLKDGYVHLKDIYTTGEVENLRNLLTEELSRDNLNTISDVMIDYPEILDLVRNKKLRDPLAEILGNNFLVVPQSSFMKNSFGVFHTDTTGAEVNGETFPHNSLFRMVTVAIYLQDNGPSGGGITLVPGSHSKPDKYIQLTKDKHRLREELASSKIKRLIQKASRNNFFNALRPFEKCNGETPILSKAGDVVIWDMRMIHRATQATSKNSTQDKLAILFTCGKNNSVTINDYMKYMHSVPENSFLAEKHNGRPLFIEDNFTVI